MKRAAVFFLIAAAFPLNLHAKSSVDTLQIKGTLSIHPDVLALNGDFTYTIQNRGASAQDQWVLAVHPLVDILAVRSGELFPEVLSQFSGGYRILTVILPLKPNERGSVTIRFSILPQKEDPRLTLDDKGAFLDARRLWFPTPIDDKEMSYEITVSTPARLRALMAGRILSDRESPAGNVSVWTSELNNISLSGTLILTDKTRSKNGTVYCYDNLEPLIQPFFPYWKALSERRGFFPLTEIHLFPIDIRIPGKGDNFADGEFIGNIMLLDNKLITAAAQAPEYAFALSGPAQKRLIETMLHELFHAYLPGVLLYPPQESLIMESFVQYLTWNLAASQDPEWAEEISRRDRFLMLNLLTSRDTQNPIWKYLLGASLFEKAFEQSSLKGLALADTLAEKYRDTSFTLADIIETAEIHQNLGATNERIYTEFLNEFNRTFLYNTALQRITTNFPSSFEGPSETLTILRVRHSYPKEWRGILTWADSKKTNSVLLTVPAGSSWVSNFSGTIRYAVLKSPFDSLEQFLGDNLLPEEDPGWKLTEHLNSPDFLNEAYLKRENIMVRPLVLNTLQLYREMELSYLWDNTKGKEVQVYLVDAKNIRHAFITLVIQTGPEGSREIVGLFNPLEKRILSRKKQQ